MLPKITKIACSLVVASTLAFTSAVQATVVEIRTNMGNIQVNLFDQTTPRTVENFLTYVNAGTFAGSVSHRSVPDFIVQMGGFSYGGTFPPDAIATNPPVVNEPVLSNVRGTIAMAKVGGNANSATSQFFINVNNNSTNLDTQNGGFTVFGQVIGDGMLVADAINDLTRFNFGSPFSELPLRNYTNTNVEPTADNIVIVNDIVIIDATVNSNPTLNPVRNTLLNSGGGGDSGGDSGGGTLGFGFIAGLFLIAIKRRTKK
jgi:peptidyl-prolyl cis-trans isomerase A (cyclophilin A)